MLNFCDFIQVYVFTTNHHLKSFRFCHFIDVDLRKCNRAPVVLNVLPRAAFKRKKLS